MPSIGPGKAPAHARRASAFPRLLGNGGRHGAVGRGADRASRAARGHAAAPCPARRRPAAPSHERSSAGAAALRAGLEARRRGRAVGHQVRPTAPSGPGRRDRKWRRRRSLLGGLAAEAGKAWAGLSVLR